MQLSRAVTETALLLKRHTPRFYASIRHNTPRQLRSIINERMTVDSLGADNPKQVFTNIFRKNWWNNGESRSGWGAELKRTVSIRAELPEFVRRHSIGSLLDAPCGDFTGCDTSSGRPVSNISGPTSSRISWLRTDVNIPMSNSSNLTSFVIGFQTLTHGLRGIS
jgi:hypothetical protein